MYSFMLFLLSLITCLLQTESANWLEFQQPSKENNFKFSNCDIGRKVPLSVKNLSFTPDPIRFDDYLTVKLDVLLRRDIGVNHKKIEVDISFRIKIKEGVFTELCDLIDEKACHYNDFCAEIDKYMEKHECPPFVPETYHNNCSCPFTKAEYNIKPIPFKLPKLSFELRGTFEMTINIQEEGMYLGCVEIQFCISDCKPLGSGLGEKRVSPIPFTP